MIYMLLCHKTHNHCRLAAACCQYSDSAVQVSESDLFMKRITFKFEMLTAMAGRCGYTIYYSSTCTRPCHLPRLIKILSTQLIMKLVFSHHIPHSSTDI